MKVANDPIHDFVVAISPMLTVWRKLHLEFDSMGAPPTSGPEANFVTASMDIFYQNKPAPGKSLVTVVHSNGEPGLNLFENGKLEIPEKGTFRVEASDSRLAQANSIRTSVRIDGVWTGPITNTTVMLYDDDDRYLTNDPPLYESILDLQSPPLPALGHVEPCISTNQLKFAAAYITLVNVNALGWNTQPTVPFYRHADVGLLASPFDVGNQQLKGTDRAEFWAFTVVFGYEAERKEDGEPTTEDPLLGATREPLGGLFYSFSAVYLESIRDHQFSQVSAAAFVAPNERENLRNRILEELYATVAHEIGHAPGNQLEGTDHDEKGIMTKGTTGATRQGFNPATIRRFRSATSWAH